MIYPFVVGDYYRRRDVYEMIGLPESTKGGNWDTGYASYHGDYFVFCNVGTAGRTGHDYNNHWIGNDLHWYGKTSSHLSQPTIQALISPATNTYVFHRADSGAPFMFAGLGHAKHVYNTRPAQVLWSFRESDAVSGFPDEVPTPNSYVEGATRQVWVNRYERSRTARDACVAHYGCSCAICGKSLEDRYGPVGAGLIHVHHLVPLADMGEAYQLDPIQDLRPVCPNCHAILHARNPPFGIEELKGILAAHAGLSSG